MSASPSWITALPSLAWITPSSGCSPGSSVKSTVYSRGSPSPSSTVTLLRPCASGCPMVILRSPSWIVTSLGADAPGRPEPGTPGMPGVPSSLPGSPLPGVLEPGRPGITGMPGVDPGVPLPGTPLPGTPGMPDGVVPAPGVPAGLVLVPGVGISGTDGTDGAGPGPLPGPLPGPVPVDGGVLTGGIEPDGVVVPGDEPPGVDGGGVVPVPGCVPGGVVPVPGGVVAPLCSNLFSYSP